MAKNRDVAIVAKALGVSPPTVRYGLRSGAFTFGTAVKRKEWVYILYPQEVKKELGVEIGKVEERS